ncbi:predicted protein [Naegleria gruberi]|uniref:Predicted protein n=1 Tax=Naegleria gruberi TaxID=5762 RepID=D2V2B4_NAEGR|nr:uncharacterized protein NAEGRDRAFT_62943 [Naegleria gruberi]EFC49027.1 predicted protein [Naegleria gruberi]|eukprot:XP_002681771.1 predicted protein [Naegleria gruberi strain NEG-M]
MSAQPNAASSSSSVLVGGGVSELDNIKFAPNKRFVFRNWANIYKSKPTFVHHPKSEEEIQTIVKVANFRGEKVKVIGSGHSPCDISLTNGHMIILDQYSKIISVDKEKLTAKVQAGTTIETINAELYKNYNMAIAVLGSISFQTISGIISTGTHGTGINFGCLPTFIVEMDIVLPSGQVVTVKKGDEDFDAYVCSLGCLGIISTVTIQCVEAFALTQVQEPSTLTKVLENLDSLIPSSDHWRFWWFPHTTNDKCITTSATRSLIDSKTFVGDSDKITFFGRIRNFFIDRLVGFYSLEFALFVSKFIPSLIPMINNTWFNLLFSSKTQVHDVSFKVFNFDCLFKQFVNEWSIPIENTKEALLRLKKMIEEKKYKVHFPVEVRFVKRDDVWLSPCYGRDSCYIGIIMYRPYDFTIPYQEYFAEYNRIMLELGGRPHWAKLDWKLDSEDLYPKWNDFKNLRRKNDTNNILMNDYLERLNL